MSHITLVTDARHSLACEGRLLQRSVHRSHPVNADLYALLDLRFSILIVWIHFTRGIFSVMPPKKVCWTCLHLILSSNGVAYANTLPRPSLTNTSGGGGASTRSMQCQHHTLPLRYPLFTTNTSRGARTRFVDTNTSPSPFCTTPTCHRRGC